MLLFLNKRVKNLSDLRNLRTKNYFELKLIRFVYPEKITLIAA